MKLIIFYLIGCLALVAWLWSLDVRTLMPDWLSQYNLAIKCSLIGSLGGIVYCLRAVYVNRGAKDHWNDNWNVWYYLRPLVSFLIGGVSYVFLNAGLLVLDAGQSSSSSNFGYLVAHE